MQLSPQPGYRQQVKQLAIVSLTAVITACGVSLPSETTYNNLDVSAESAPEENLLDVGIVVFDAGLDNIRANDLTPDLVAIREAESRYMPVVLRQTLEGSGRWGQLFLLPEADAGLDVLITGEIIESSGHTLELRIAVSDARGARWFDRRYTAHVGDNVYGSHSLGVNDPFQGLYNRIANDLNEYRLLQMDEEAIRETRALAELRFSNRFSATFASRYFNETREGRFQLQSMPSLSDPMAARMEAIRERDQFFLYTLVEQHEAFARQIAGPYFNWRRDYYNALLSVRDDQDAARWRAVSGVLLLGVAVAVSDVSSVLGATASAAAGYQGSSWLNEGLAGFMATDTSTLFLDELQRSFSNEARSHVVDLESRTVTLTGSVQEMYSQWQGILQAIIAEERGL